MRQPGPEELPPRLDERQKRIHRRLGLIGPGPAAFFRDACLLINRRVPLASASHLVGHLLREVESAIRAVLKGIGELARQHGIPQSNHKREIQEVLTALDISESDPVAKAWLRLCGQADAYALHRLAHRDSLASPRPINDEFRAFWSETLTLLDVVLDRFEARYLAVMPTLDALLSKQNPTGYDAKTLKSNVPNNVATLGYFFGKLDNPAWLEPLRQEGFFDRSPEPIVNDDEQMVSFPPWPPMRYLRRMASREPELVASIGASIPLTDNMSVHVDLLETALALPADIAHRLLPHLKHGIECRYKSILFTHNSGKLLLHLTDVPQNNDAALDLARAMFAVSPDADRPENQEAEHRSFSRPRARLDLHEYERLAGQVVRQLASRCGVPALRLFCDLLEEAVSAGQRTNDDEDREDRSHIWCQEVEHCSRRHDVRCLLIAAVRDSAECLIENRPATIHDIVRLLEARRWKVFDRLALHILRLCPGDRLATDRLLKRESFDDLTLRREYNKLLEKGFGHLESQERSTILSWIEQGPNVQEYCDGRERVFGQRPSEQEALEYADHWRLERLHPIRDSHPPEWRARYDALIERFGVPKVYPSVSTFSWGSKSPLEAEQIRSMGMTEIVSFLKTWNPAPDDHFGPSREGLANAIQQAVAAEPARFATAAHDFAELHPAHVSALLAGLREATKLGLQQEWWPPVLCLCEGIVAQPCEAPMLDEKHEDRHRPSRWLRQTVASLISSGLDQTAAEIPIELRAQIWQILLPLTSDPDPSPASEARDADGNLDPLTRSLNTVRGEAMHAAIKYGLWVRRDADRCGPTRCPSFDYMPEVSELLDRHLDVKVDPSPAMRSIYGQWFPWLCTLDQEWAASRVEAIFPPEPAQTNHWEAAWQPYIVFCQPYGNVFQLLRKQYRRAILDIEREIPYEVAGNADHREQLAEHVMILYGRGVLPLGDQDDLLNLFFSAAPLKVRSHALGFVGRSLQEEKGPVPADVIERFQLLWGRRIETLRGVANRTGRSELTAFGWWFACGKFDQRWALDRLQESLELSGWTEPDHLVVEHLATIVADFPKDAVGCLSMLVDGDEDGWGISSWSNHATTILKSALVNEDEDTRKESANIINRLCSRGFYQFRDLIDKR